VERDTPFTAGLLTARRILFLVAAICVATVSYLFLLAWAIAYAALSQAPPWWRTLIASTKTASLSWLWLSHALAVVLVTIPIALAVRFCFMRRTLVAAFSVSVLVFLVMGLPVLPLSFAKQPLFVVLWTIWEQVLLIGTLPAIVWIIEGWGRRREPRGELRDVNVAP
jgi:hypothetical protein